MFFKKAFLYVFSAGLVYLSTGLSAQSSCPVLFQSRQVEPSVNRRFELPITTSLDEDKFKSPVRISPEMKVVRRDFLASLKNDSLRETLASTMEVDLRLASADTQRKFEKMSLRNQTMSYDVVVIGAGVHGVIAAATLLRTNPKLKILVVEGTDTVASNFRLARDMFRINSSNRASSESLLPVPGEGNINQLPSLPIQVSDLTAEKYPSANDLAIPILTGMYGLIKSYPTVNLLFNSRVVSTRMKSDGTVDGLQLKLSTGAEYTVNSQVVLATTGLGKSKTPFEVLRRQKTPEDIQSIAKLEKIPQVISFDDAFRMLAQNSNPLEFFTGKKVGIVGQGDSANVFVEFLLGYGPKKAYGASDAQDKTPSRIVWFGQAAKTCEDFIKKARSRYAQIGTGFRSSSPDRRPILRSAGKVKRASERRRENEVQLELEDGSTQEVDYLIVATGYEQQLRNLFNSRDRDDIAFFDRSFEYVEGETSISEGDNVRIARALKPKAGNRVSNKFSFVVTGPAAGKLPKDEELLGIIQNSVSIFNNAPRVEAIAKMIAKQIRPLASNSEVDGSIASGAKVASQAFRINDLQEYRLFQAQPENYVRTSLANLLSYFQFSSRGNLEIDLVYDSSTDSLIVSSSSGYDISGFVKLLTATRDLPNFLKEVARSSGSISGIKLKAQISSAQNSFKVDPTTLVLATLGKDFPVANVSRANVVANSKLPLQGE